MGFAKQVASLESLERALKVEVVELRKERDRALESRTLLGHAKNFTGYLLSAYCIYRRAPPPPAPLHGHPAAPPPPTSTCVPPMRTLPHAGVPRQAR